MTGVFSLVKLALRLIFILVDMFVNYQTLVTKQPFFPGVSMDYVPFIVLFNAGMIFFICFIDMINATLNRYRLSEEIGEGILDLYHHEH